MHTLISTFILGLSLLCSSNVSAAEKAFSIHFKNGSELAFYQVGEAGDPQLGIYELTLIDESGKEESIKNEGRPFILLTSFLQDAINEEREDYEGREAFPIIALNGIFLVLQDGRVKQLVTVNLYNEVQGILVRPEGKLFYVMIDRGDEGSYTAFLSYEDKIQAIWHAHKPFRLLTSEEHSLAEEAVNAYHRENELSITQPLDRSPGYDLRAIEWITPAEARMTYSETPTLQDNFDHFLQMDSDLFINHLRQIQALLVIHQGKVVVLVENEQDWKKHFGEQDSSLVKVGKAKLPKADEPVLLVLIRHEKLTHEQLHEYRQVYRELSEDVVDFTSVGALQFTQILLQMDPEQIETTMQSGEIGRSANKSLCESMFKKYVEIPKKDRILDVGLFLSKKIAETK